MTIPPASVRSVRKCEDCVFRSIATDGYYEEGYWCLIMYPTPDYWDGKRDFERCEDNFTTDEIRALIDQHNQQEQQP